MNKYLLFITLFFATAFIPLAQAEYDNPYDDGEVVNSEPVESNPYADKPVRKSTPKISTQPTGVSARNESNALSSTTHKTRIRDARLNQFDKLVNEEKYDEAEAILDDLDKDKDNREVVALLREYVDELRHAATRAEKLKINMRYMGKMMNMIGKSFDDLGSALESVGP